MGESLCYVTRGDVPEESVIALFWGADVAPNDESSDLLQVWLKDGSNFPGSIHYVNPPFSGKTRKVSLLLIFDSKFSPAPFQDKVNKFFRR